MGSMGNIETNSRNLPELLAFKKPWKGWGFIQRCCNQTAERQEEIIINLSSSQSQNENVYEIILIVKAVKRHLQEKSVPTLSK